MTQSEPTSKIFRRLPRKAAEEHFRQFVASQEERLEAFESLVQARGGPRLDGSDESFRQLGPWLAGALEEGPRDPASVPVWAATGDDFRGRLSSESLQLLDGASLYFATILRRRHPHLRWMLATDTTIDDYHQPVLVGFGLTRLPSIGPIRRVFSERMSESPDANWLLRAFRVWDEHALGGGPSAVPDEDLGAIDDVDVLALDGDPEWDVELWIPDYAEHVLGKREFRRLPERIEAIDGIERLAWEDRERFLAKLRRNVDLDELKSSVGEAMRAAAAERQRRPA